ncbi:uncharacterized protein LOC131070889 isoform X1 [Cryptomeria japonica]|uniref:uncharacterized protein LOC131070889 isoform X1 n=2 Tax=Cryptomeria japonica TaxID=3369 RepID=UPI0025ABB388|nr:uncharacterized protein LOC131070889 isoform X1 [Cryptomeria japonica]
MQGNRVEFVSMEDSSNDRALRGPGDAEAEQSGQCNNTSSEATNSPHNRERSQAFCEDTANKTIEFLRARLLAERATSRAAKEAAEKNAKRLMELERMLEIETERKKKAEEDMHKVIEKLRIARLSSASNHSDSDQTGIENQGIKEETEEPEGGSSLNSIGIAAIKEKEEIIEVDVKNNRLQENDHSSASSALSVEQRKEESNDFTNQNAKAQDHDQNKESSQDQVSSQSETESKDDGIVLSSPSQNLDVEDQMPNQSNMENNGTVLSPPSLQSEDIQDQMSEQSETKDNCIILSSPSLISHNALTESCMPLMKDDLNGKGDVFQGPLAPENFTNRSAATNPRPKPEDKSTGLFEQMRNVVTPVAGQDQKEFLRLKLHELVDQIVSASEKEIHKYENSSLQTFDISPEFSALESSYVQKTRNDRSSKGSNFQLEVPSKAPNRVNSLEEDKLSGFRIQNERAPASSMRMIRSKRHENANGNGTHCSAVRGNLCTCQHSDFSDTFLPVKEELCGHNHFQNTIPINISRRQASGMQACLENEKAIELHCQCRSFSEVHRDNCGKEIQYTMRCSMGTTTTQNGSYHDHEKTMRVRRSSNDIQAAGCTELGNSLELSRDTKSDGFTCMPRQHDLDSSHSNSYLMKREIPESRFTQRKQVRPSWVGPSSMRNGHKYLPLQVSDSCNDMPGSNKNAGDTEIYPDYKFSPMLSVQWPSRGSPLADNQLPMLPGSRVGDALMALREAKEQIQSSIETRQKLKTHVGMSSPNGQNSCRKLVLR